MKESAIGCSESRIAKSPLADASEFGAIITAEIELTSSKNTKL